jgi:hypothetical protein
MHKKYYLYLSFLILGLFTVGSFSSCKTKEGCKNTEGNKVKTTKSGELSTKRGSSNLFSKKQRKKMKG